MKKKMSLAAVIAFVIATIVLVIANPFKVVDPKGAGFDPDHFEFSDYCGNSAIRLRDVYVVLFPPGTPKDFVDRVLVRAGGAKSTQYLSGINVWVYERPATFCETIVNFGDWKGGQRDQFFFDQNNNLIVGTYEGVRFDEIVNPEDERARKSQREGHE